MEIISTIQEVPDWWLPNLHGNQGPIQVCPHWFLFCLWSFPLNLPSGRLWLHFLELQKEPVFSAPMTLKVCRRSKTRLMKEKQEGMKTHSTSGLQSQVCLYVPRPQTHFLLKNECASNSLENGEPLVPRWGARSPWWQSGLHLCSLKGWVDPIFPPK